MDDLKVVLRHAAPDARGRQGRADILDSAGSPHDLVSSHLIQ
jgi:hypothetical protein